MQDIADILRQKIKVFNLGFKKHNSDKYCEKMFPLELSLFLTPIEITDPNLGPIINVYPDQHPCTHVIEFRYSVTNFIPAY